MTHITEADNIEKVQEEFGISGAEVPCLTIDKLDVQAEYIFVLCEVRRAAWKLGADKKVTISRAPRILRELHETMLVLAGDMCANVNNYYTTDKNTQDYVDTEDKVLPKIFPHIPNTAKHCEQCDEARKLVL